MEVNGNLSFEDENEGTFDPKSPEDKHSLVRLLKPIMFNPERGKHIDSAVVSPMFYNCFNYSMLAKEHTGVNLTVGITSANVGEGKTLVASNLSVSLASANQRDTVLVDLNLQSPRIHKIFGTRLAPGLAETLNDRPIQVSHTQVKHLYILSAGQMPFHSLNADYLGNGEQVSLAEAQSTLGLDQLASFRNVLYSLRQEFEFVIVDMPALHEPRIPILLTNQMDGLIVVVDANRTKHEHIEKMFRRVNQNQVIGFVFNRVTKEYAQ